MYRTILISTSPSAWRSLLCLAVGVAALTFVATGCSSDDETGGDDASAAVDAGEPDAGNLSDGQAGGADAASDAAAAIVDGVVSADAPTIDAGATDAGLAADASSADTVMTDAANSKPDVPIKKCGDGVCEAPTETLITCAVDCAGGANCGDGDCLSDGRDCHSGRRAGGAHPRSCRDPGRARRPRRLREWEADGRAGSR